MVHTIATVIKTQGDLDLKQLAQGCTYAPRKNASRGPSDFFASHPKDELRSQALLTVYAKHSLKVLWLHPGIEPGPSASKATMLTTRLRG